MQRSAYGGGGNTLFRQVATNPRDQVRPAVTPVNRAVGVYHNALRVGQDGKVPRAKNGVAKALKHWFCCTDQRVISLF